MTKLNYWNADLEPRRGAVPLRSALRRLPGGEGRQGQAAIFHFGTGNHHIVGLKLAENGSNCAVLGITASPQEYDDYVELLIKNPRLGHTYKAYFGDIYQLDAPPAAAVRLRRACSTSASSARPRTTPMAR